MTKSPRDPSPYGGSYKLFFLHWAPPYGERGSLVYTNGKRLDYQYYVTGLSKIRHQALRGSTSLNGVLNLPGAPEFRDREWYEFVFLHKKTGVTTSRGGAWVRRLTRGTGLMVAPSSWSWVALDYEFSKPVPAAVSFELGGNKNHGNEFDQWIVWGPWQVVDAEVYPNPFGVPLH